MQPCLGPDLELSLSGTDFTWQLLVLGIACLLLPGEGSVYLFIYSCLLNDKFVIPCLFHVIRKISMVGCRITFGLRPHVIRHPTIDIFPYYVNKQGITNNIPYPYILHNICSPTQYSIFNAIFHIHIFHIKKLHISCTTVNITCNVKAPQWDLR